MGESRSDSDYSVLRASTGSFFAAKPEGIRPAMSVSPTLIATRITQAMGSRNALRELIPVRW